MLQDKSEQNIRDRTPNGAEFKPRSLTAVERAFFNSVGYVRLENLWTPQFAGALADEARGRWRFAELPKKGPRTPVPESRMLREVTPAATGSLLTSLHFEMVGLVRALTGRMLVPTFSAYGYYETNDHVLLHLDQEQCDITLVATAFGKVGPLHLHPKLRGMTTVKLGKLESDPAWDHASGLAVIYPARGPMALSGNVLPHNRPGKPIPELSAVAALCYRSLF